MNVRKTQISETQVNGKSYTLTQFSATSGIKYLKKIQKLLVPIWAEAVASEGTITPETIRMASDKFCELDEADIRSMVCEACSIMPAAFDQEFAGQYMGLFNLVKEIIMFNFSEVFTQLGLEDQ